MQAFIHSYLSFLDFLGHVIHLCKSTLVLLMETYFKPLRFFLQQLQIDKPLKRHVPSKSPKKIASHPKRHNFTIDFKLFVMIFKFAPSFLT